MKIYINGVLANTLDVTTLKPEYTFEWNMKNKKMYIGTAPPPKIHDYVAPPEAPVYIQKLYWYNAVLSPQEISALSKESIIPTPESIIGDNVDVPPPPSPPTNLRTLFDGVMNTGKKFIKIGNYVYPVFVYVSSYGKWLMIMNYHHRAGTNPDLYIRGEVDGFPMHRHELGFDGSTDRTTYGHVGNKLLNALYTQCGGFTKMLFYGENSKGNLIHFMTSDQKFIDYARTGRGSLAGGYSWQALPGHNASIPTHAPNVYDNQGDRALTEYPFWRWGEAHWSVKGWGKNWEVDDWQYNMRVEDMPHTIHHIYIGL
jgi:hypothetical protein